MDSIQKDITVNYYRPSTSEVITMTILMNRLTADYHTYNKWIKDIQEGVSQDTIPIEVCINKANRLYEQLCILKEIGFYTSNNNRDIQPPNEIII